MNGWKAVNRPDFREATAFWLKLGFISFGGPTGQIAIMHRELVEKRGWVDEPRFFHALNYCMLLPGPEAQQLAIYIGWLLHGTAGGIVAGTLFVLPAAVILWILSVIYVYYGKVAWVAGALAGLKPAVLAIVAAAVLRIGSKVLKNNVMLAIAGLAFLAIFVSHLPFPLILAGAATLGMMGERFWPAKFAVLKGHGPTAEVVEAEHFQPSWGRSLRVLAIWLSLWLGPILLVRAWFGSEHVLFQEGVFFSQAAMVTFGGAYAVLPYVSQQAVQAHGWLGPAEMLDGLGLAETTPGPLIMVLQFVGFLGGWKLHSPLSPLACATAGAALTTWVTFLPCFLWIFLGAPYVERLRGNQRLTAALSAVTAAVVGVVLNLAVWLGIHILWPLNWFALLLSTTIFAGLVIRKWDVIPVVLAACLLGILRASLTA